MQPIINAQTASKRTSSLTYNIFMNPYPNLIFKLLLCLLVVGLIRPLQAQTTVNFNYTGAPQTWVVPGGVTSIQVEAYGGGGSAGTFGDEQQVGGKITATMAVTAGQTLNIYVGGKGVNGVGGYNGGGTTRVYLNTSYGRGWWRNRHSGLGAQRWATGSW